MSTGFDVTTSFQAKNPVSIRDILGEEYGERLMLWDQERFEYHYQTQQNASPMFGRDGETLFNTFHRTKV